MSTPLPSVADICLVVTTSNLVNDDSPFSARTIVTINAEFDNLAKTPFIVLGKASLITSTYVFALKNKCIYSVPNALLVRFECTAKEVGQLYEHYFTLVARMRVETTRRSLLDYVNMGVYAESVDEFKKRKEKIIDLLDVFEKHLAVAEMADTKTSTDNKTTTSGENKSVFVVGTRVVRKNLGPSYANFRATIQRIVAPKVYDVTFDNTNLSSKEYKEDELELLTPERERPMVGEKVKIINSVSLFSSRVGTIALVIADKSSVSGSSLMLKFDDGSIVASSLIDVERIVV